MPRKAKAPAAAAAAAPSLESEKENVADGATAPNPKSPPVRAAGKGLNTTRNWEEELEALNQKLKRVSLEKDEADRRVEEREARIKEQQEELEIRMKEKEKLQERLKKLEKVKPFEPVLSIPLPEDAKKKKNDPDRLKKPMSVYLLWCNEQRAKQRAENPNNPLTSAMLGEMWKNVSEEEKRQHEDQYQKSMEEYKKQASVERREAEAIQLLHSEENAKCAMEVYEQYLEYQKSLNDDSKSKKKEKDPDMPKKPPSAYFLFCDERRPALVAAKTKVPEIGRLLGQEWKNADEETRARYEKAAAEQKAIYLEQMEEYKKKKAEESKPAEEAAKEKAKIDRVLALEKLKMKEKEEELKKALKSSRASRKGKAKQEEAEKPAVKPKAKSSDKEKPAEKERTKRGPTAFNLFSKEYRSKIQAQRPGTTFSEMSTLLSTKWGEMSAEDKQPYVEQAAAAKANVAKEQSTGSGEQDETSE